MSHIIDSLIAKIKFEVDSKALDAIDVQLKKVSEKITAFDSKFTTIAKKMADVEAKQALASQRNAKAKQLEADANLKQQKSQESMAAGFDKLAKARLNYAKAEKELASIVDAKEKMAHEEKMFHLKAELEELKMKHNRKMQYLKIEAIVEDANGKVNLLSIRNEANLEQWKHNRIMADKRQELAADNNASRERVANIRKEAAMRSGGMKLGGVLGMLNSPLAGALAVGGMGASFLMSGVVNPARKLASLESAFTSLTGSKAAARDELGFVRQQADYLGLEFGGSAEQYKGIFAAAATNKNVGAAGARQIFKGFGSMSTVLGLNTEQQQRMYKAIGQMLSKEQVMSEELKGQLAESYPAAISLFTRAYSQVKGKEISVKQFQEKMAKGEVGSDVVLVASKLAEQDANKGGALDARRKSEMAEQNRLKSEKDFAASSIYQGGLADGLSKFFKELRQALPQVIPLLTAFGATLGNVLSFVGSLAKAITTNLKLAFDTFSMIVDGANFILSQFSDTMEITVKSAATGFAAMGAAAWLFVRHPAILALMGIFAVIQDLVYFLDGDDRTISILDNFNKKAQKSEPQPDAFSDTNNNFLQGFGNNLGKVGFSLAKKGDELLLDNTTNPLKAAPLAMASALLKGGGLAIGGLGNAFNIAGDVQFKASDEGIDYRTQLERRVSSMYTKKGADGVTFYIDNVNVAANDSKTLTNSLIQATNAKGGN